MTETALDPARRASDRRRLLVVVGLAYLLAFAAAALTVRLVAPLPPVWAGLIADLVATVVVFGFSVGCNNSSLYDPYWSVAPVPLTLYWAARGGPIGARQWLVLALVAAWGARLTYNCLSRWRSLADEDFRYVEIRAKTGRTYWPASLVSIHLMPTAWVFLGLLPLVPVLTGPQAAVAPLDLLATAVTAVAVGIEALADLQLQRFLSQRSDPAAVLDTGLWANSRHPNYFGEVTFWWGLWLFGMAARPASAWTAIGPLSITLLFVLVSIPWMDRRMLSRHPGWAHKMSRTSALIPWRPRTIATAGAVE